MTAQEAKAITVENQISKEEVLRDILDRANKGFSTLKYEGILPSGKVLNEIKSLGYELARYVVSIENDEIIIIAWK